jgi:hypothetical protein
MALEVPSALVSRLMLRIVEQLLDRRVLRVVEENEGGAADRRLHLDSGDVVDLAVVVELLWAVSGQSLVGHGVEVPDVPGPL